MNIKCVKAPISMGCPNPEMQNQWLAWPSGWVPRPSGQWRSTFVQPFGHREKLIQTVASGVRVPKWREILTFSCSLCNLRLFYGCFSVFCVFLCVAFWASAAEKPEAHAGKLQQRDVFHRVAHRLCHVPPWPVTPSAVQKEILIIKGIRTQIYMVW